MPKNKQVHLEEDANKGKLYFDLSDWDPVSDDFPELAGFSKTGNERFQGFYALADLYKNEFKAKLDGNGGKLFVEDLNNIFSEEIIFSAAEKIEALFGLVNKTIDQNHGLVDASKIANNAKTYEEQLEKGIDKDTFIKNQLDAIVNLLTKEDKKHTKDSPIINHLVTLMQNGDLDKASAFAELVSTTKNTYRKSNTNLINYLAGHLNTIKQQYSKGYASEKANTHLSTDAITEIEKTIPSASHYKQKALESDIEALKIAMNALATVIRAQKLSTFELENGTNANEVKLNDDYIERYNTANATYNTLLGYYLIIKPHVAGNTTEVSALKDLVINIEKEFTKALRAIKAKKEETYAAETKVANMPEFEPALNKPAMNDATMTLSGDSYTYTLPPGEKIQNININGINNPLLTELLIYALQNDCLDAIAIFSKDDAGKHYSFPKAAIDQFIAAKSAEQAVHALLAMTGDSGARMMPHDDDEIGQLLTAHYENVDYLFVENKSGNYQFDIYYDNSSDIVSPPSAIYFGNNDSDFTSALFKYAIDNNCLELISKISSNVPDTAGTIKSTFTISHAHLAALEAATSLAEFDAAIKAMGGTLDTSSADVNHIGLCEIAKNRFPAFKLAKDGDNFELVITGGNTINDIKFDGIDDPDGLLNNLFKHAIEQDCLQLLVGSPSSPPSGQVIYGINADGITALLNAKNENELMQAIVELNGELGEDLTGSPLEAKVAPLKQILTDHLNRMANPDNKLTIKLDGDTCEFTIKDGTDITEVTFDGIDDAFTKALFEYAIKENKLAILHAEESKKVGDKTFSFTRAHLEALKNASTQEEIEVAMTNMGLNLSSTADSPANADDLSKFAALLLDKKNVDYHANDQDPDPNPNPNPVPNHDDGDPAEDMVFNAHDLDPARYRPRADKAIAENDSQKNNFVWLDALVESDRYPLKEHPHLMNLLADKIQAVANQEAKRKNKQNPANMDSNAPEFQAHVTTFAGCVLVDIQNIIKLTNPVKVRKALKEKFGISVSGKELSAIMRDMEIANLLKQENVGNRKFNSAVKERLASIGRYEKAANYLNDRTELLTAQTSRPELQNDMLKAIKEQTQEIHSAIKLIQAADESLFSDKQSKANVLTTLDDILTNLKSAYNHLQNISKKQQQERAYFTNAPDSTSVAKVEFADGQMQVTTELTGHAQLIPNNLNSYQLHNAIEHYMGSGLESTPGAAVIGGDAAKKTYKTIMADTEDQFSNTTTTIMRNEVEIAPDSKFIRKKERVVMPVVIVKKDIPSKNSSIQYVHFPVGGRNKLDNAKGNEHVLKLANDLIENAKAGPGKGSPMRIDDSFPPKLGGAIRAMCKAKGITCHGGLNNKKIASEEKAFTKLIQKWPDIAEKSGLGIERSTMHDVRKIEKETNLSLSRPSTRRK